MKDVIISLFNRDKVTFLDINCLFISKLSLINYPIKLI